MPQQFEIGQGATALELNLFTRLGGYGWLDGAGVTLGGSTSSIECNVAAGTVLVDGEITTVASQSVTLQAGDPQNPRKDIVYVDYNGAAKVQAGIASATDPPGETRQDTWAPAPPPGTSIDGVPLAEVWVPTGASDTGDLQAADIADRRVQAVNGGGRIRELSSDPDTADLINSQFWRNTTENELRAYFADTDEIRQIDTSAVSGGSGAGPDEVIIEDFDDDISANWRGGESGFTYSTPAFEGTNAAFFSGANSRDVSNPGDGLSTYPDSGDTIALAIYGIVDGGDAFFAFGSEDSEFDRGEYRVRAENSGGTLTVDLVRFDSTSGPGTNLGSVSYNSYSQSAFYIMEVDYGGSGTHPFRLWSTSGGSRDTKLAEETSPTSDTTYQGRGIAVGGSDEFRIDRLAVADG